MHSSDMLAVLDGIVGGTGGRTIDLGCGEGQVMRHLGGNVVGTDLSSELLTHAARTGPVVQARLPDLSWVRRGSIDRAIAVGVLEMLDDHHALFAATASVVRRDGHLLIVMNHPVATAPSSEPLVDPGGEVLWKWGDYLASSSWTPPLGDRTVRFFHRPLGVVLSAAAVNGWVLEHMIEAGPSRTTLERFPEYRGQESIPTLLGMRWVRAAATREIPLR